MFEIPKDSKSATVSNSAPPAGKEKFNVGDFIIAATSVMNDQESRIAKLERQIFWHQFEIVLLLGAISCIWK